MSINSGAINTFVVNGAAGSGGVIATGSGTLVEIEQYVMILGSGTLVDIEQEVVFHETGDGTLVSIEQSVQSIASGTLVSLEQRVLDSSVPSHESRTGWDFTLLVDGVTIPREQIHGMCSIVKTSNSSSLMDVTLIPPTGIQDLDFWQGKSVTLDVHTNNTTTDRVFTGVVDIPEVDIIEQKITLRCTNKRRELINTTQQAVVPGIGFYNSTIFSDADELASELDQRLTTIPYSFDFDGNNNGILSAWAPKVTPDYVLDDPDIYYDKPQVEMASRGRIINTVNIDFEYRYPRLWHKSVGYSWSAPYTSTNSACLIIGQGYSLTPRESIEAAASAAGWVRKREITYTDIPPNGFYRCGDARGYFTTISTTVNTTAKKDGDGNVITDSNGNPIPDTSNRSQVTDLRYTFCGGANWSASKRWAQDVSEKYSLTVASSQSVAQYGAIEKDEAYGVDSTFNTDDWEDYNEFNGPSGSYHIDVNTDLATFNSAVTVALQIAKTSIEGSHRDTRVKLFRSIMPDLELHHTVEATADKISCKGTVRKIIHKLNVNTGEAVTNMEIALSRATGSSSGSSMVPPTRPVDNPVIANQTISLGNHYGQDPSTDAAQSWNGMIGNSYTGPYGSGVRTTFPESFVVDAPAISSTLRNQRVLNQSQSYNVAIRNDSLVVNFNDG